jgi:hypothetical protein
MFPLLQNLIDLFAVHLHLLQTLQVITVSKRKLMRSFPLLQDLIDLLLAVYLHLPPGPAGNHSVKGTRS